MPNIERKVNFELPREQPRMLYIPDTLATWPWRREISPHYEEVKAASRAWVDKYAHCFKRGLEQLENADVGECILSHLLTNHAHPLLLKLLALSASLLYATGTKGP